MRHKQVLAKESYKTVDIPAVWPRTPNILALDPPARTDEVQSEAASFQPTPAAPDIPAAVGGMIIGSYVALISAFAVGMAGSAQSIYALSVVGLFLVAFFAVPRIFFAIEPQQARRSTFDQFMKNGLETHTGHSSGKEALVLMLIVPVFLTFGALAMGIAAALIF